MDIVYEVSGGEIVFISGINEHSKFSADIQRKTMNLLETATVCALFYEKFLLSAIKIKSTIRAIFGLDHACCISLARNYMYI